MEILITRADAIKQGLSHYFTGNPCKHGHICKRFTVSGNCTYCAAKSYKDNPGKAQVARAKYRAKYPEKIQSDRAKYRIENPDKLKAYNAKRRATKLQAIPKWVNLGNVTKVYKNCPDGYQVDHFYPLISDWVCGLHVAENLRYLTPEENQKKSNRRLPEHDVFLCLPHRE